MGRPRKPTAHLRLIGAFEKSPQRKRDDEPVCLECVGAAPDRLTHYQVEAWDYLVESAEAGALTKMDRAYLKLCAMALASVWYWNQSGGADGANPLSPHSLKSVGDMLGKLGMTPAERSRVVIPRDPAGVGGFRPTR